MTTSTVRDPAAEAATLVGSGFTVRVLEPSPPAVTASPFLADDPPTAGEPERPGDLVVTPTSGGDRTWDELVTERPELADFARDHWLGARGRLPAVPPGYPAARDGFHRLAYAVVAEARRRANGKFGLRWTRGGFGTPFFGDDVQVRVEGAELVVQEGSTVRSAPITTLAAAAEFVGVEPGTEAAEHDSPPLGDVDRSLGVTPAAGTFLGAWFGLAWAVLEELRVTPGASEPDRPQLWPGHFDPALAIGDPEGGRATYGFSPGDSGHDEPYLYVGAWGEVDRSDPFWNEENFNGASLPYRELEASSDPYTTALDFLRGGLDRLRG